MRSPTPPAPEAPAGFFLRRQLAGGASAGVWLADHGGDLAVLRFETADSGQDLAELAVLASLDHPALARLIDHGSLPGGGRYLARAWIEGADLLEWAASPAASDARAIGKLIARLCLPLQALHRAGFVHADLKPQNVIVGPEGRVTLTDFGLARRSGGARDAVSGSAFSIAPEVLHDEAVDVRADLFALGVLIVQVFAGLHATARDFYGRFPAQDFFTAAGTSPAELPDWIADIAAGLVERDPSARPQSAAAVGRLLCARLGEDELAREFDAQLGRARFSPR
ncbi:MAG TPA: protein kinase, partial [Planctomycetota bacterium]|nr:protein kinase [Planctomycetota bacterium]